MTRIGLGALFLDPGVSGGTETYVRNLVPALLRARPETDFELATTVRGAAALATEEWAGELRLIRLPCDDDEPVRRTLLELCSLPVVARRREWDLLHSLANRGPRRAPTAHVVTAHDVIFFHHATMGALSDRAMRWAVRGAINGADEVIAVSETAADDIARTMGVDRARITAVPHGAGRPPAGRPSLERTVVRHRLEGRRVVLCVGAKRPHKNQALLVRALPLLPGDVTLVLVGHDEGYGAELERTAADAGVAHRLRLVGYVSDEELEALWAIAACAAFPTRAEGFGLPVLEAMSRAVAVACADIPVLHEVAAGAACYFSPDDPVDAGIAIAACLEDGDLGQRGRARAAEFSWERSAHETLDVYDRAIASTA